MKKLTLCLLIIVVLISIAPSYGQDQQNFLIQMKIKMAVMEKDRAAMQCKEKHQYREAAKLYEEAVLVEMQALQSFNGDQSFMREMGQSLTSSLINAAWCYRNCNQYQKAEQMLKAAVECVKQLQDSGRAFDVCEEYANFYASKGDFKNFFICYLAAYTVLHSMIQKEWGITIDVKDKDSVKPVIERYEKELTDIIAKKGSVEKKASKDLVERINRMDSLDLSYISLLYGMKQYEQAMTLLNDENMLAFQNVVTRHVTPQLLKSLTADLKKGDTETQMDTITFLGYLFILYCNNLNSIHQTITSRGMFKRYLGQYEGALVSFHEAEKLLAGAEKDALFSSEMLTIYKISNTFHIARTMQKMGERKKALELYNECIKLCDKTPYYKKFILPRIYYDMGDAWFELGDTGNATSYAEKSEQAWQEVPVEPDLMWQLHTLKGKLAEKKNDPGRALDEYLKSVSWIERFRANLFYGQEMEGFIGEKLQAYEGIVRIYVAQEKIKEAMHYVEKVKALSLTEQMATSLHKVMNDSDLSSADKNQILSLYYSLCCSNCSLKSMGGSNSPGSKEEILEIQKTISDNWNKLSALLKEKCGIESVNIFCGDIVNLDDFQAKIDNDTVYLEFFSYEDRDGAPGKVFLWTMTSGDIKCTALSTAASEIEDEVRELRMAIEEREPQWKIKAQKLYSVLIQPVEGLLRDKKRVVVSPYKGLHYLPFHALIDKQGVPLLERFTIVYSPSLVSSAIGKRKSIVPGDKAVAFSLGNVQYKDFSPLPGTKVEVKAIAGIFRDCTVIEERDFTKECVDKNMKGKNIIHFATHGDLNSDSPRESCLVASDGKYTIDDIVAARMSSRIVVLSACKTSLGKLFPGDDQVGLTRAFMYAGAPSIVSSLWSVSDESTAKLMALFYTNLEKKMDKDEALRQAEISLMKEYPDPFHWAPFILTGEWK